MKADIPVSMGGKAAVWSDGDEWCVTENNIVIAALGTGDGWKAVATRIAAALNREPRGVEFVEFDYCQTSRPIFINVSHVLMFDNEECAASYTRLIFSRAKGDSIVVRHTNAEVLAKLRGPGAPGVKESREPGIVSKVFGTGAAYKPVTDELPEETVRRSRGEPVKGGDDAV